MRTFMAIMPAARIRHRFGRNLWAIILGAHVAHNPRLRERICSREYLDAMGASDEVIPAKRQW
jgi:hypothetical protein